MEGNTVTGTLTLPYCCSNGLHGSKYGNSIILHLCAASTQRLSFLIDASLHHHCACTPAPLWALLSPVTLPPCCAATAGQ